MASEHTRHVKDRFDVAGSESTFRILLLGVDIFAYVLTDNAPMLIAPNNELLGDTTITVANISKTWLSPANWSNQRANRIRAQGKARLYFIKKKRWSRSFLSIFAQAGHIALRVTLLMTSLCGVQFSRLSLHRRHELGAQPL